MKRLLLFAALLTLPLPLLAADAPSPAANAPASAKSADDAWKELEKLRKEPEEKPLSREEAIAQLGKWFEAQKEAAEAFAKDFPDDARSWEARLMAVRASMELRRFGVGSSDPVGDRKVFDEIANAPAAPAPIKAEAAFNSAATRANELDPGKPETYAAFYKAVSDALEKYPDHPLVDEVKTLEMQTLSEDPTSVGDALLKKLVEGSDPRLAESAKAILAHHQVVADLKAKPLDLKFTSLDGHEVDTANLRGKVFLLDFWASWCGPCMAEMPHLVEAHQKYGEHGFEIVGISLDDDQTAMENAMKENGVTWPQRFEADHKITQAFGVQLIPTMFLFDKKGLLRQTSHGIEDLVPQIEKLMAE